MKISKILVNLALVASLASSAFGAYTPVNVSNFSYDSNRDGATSISFSLNGQTRNLLLVFNKKQNDTTVSGIVADAIAEDTGYVCAGQGGDDRCSVHHFYTSVVWNSNSVGAKINLTQKALDDAGGDIVFLDRNFMYIDQNIENSISRIDNSQKHTMFGKPFIKVFIDKKAI